MGSAGKSRKTGSKCRGAKVNKLGVRKAFRARHIDQVQHAAGGGTTLTGPPRPMAAQP